MMKNNDPLFMLRFSTFASSSSFNKKGQHQWKICLQCQCQEKTYSISFSVKCNKQLYQSPRLILFSKNYETFNFGYNKKTINNFCTRSLFSIKPTASRLKKFERFCYFHSKYIFRQMTIKTTTQMLCLLTLGWCGFICTFNYF